MTTTDLVPAANLAALDAMEPATREVAVTHMLSEARQWLAHAVESTGPQQIADFKAFVATVEESTRQLNLSKDIQLDATEMVRRAERGIGVAIRRGQDAGEIRRRGQGGAPAPGSQGPRSDTTLSSPEDFASHASLASNGTGIYQMTDGVSDQQFDSAITEAKAEGNLGRANLVRKIRGEAPVSSSQRPEVLRKTRRLDSNRIVEQTVLQVAGIDSLFGEIDFAELDRSEIPHWIKSLTASITALRTLRLSLSKEIGE